MYKFDQSNGPLFVNHLLHNTLVVYMICLLWLVIYNLTISFYNYKMKNDTSNF
jgi:hypothetical protein